MPLDPDYDLFLRVAAAGSLSAAARGINQSPAQVSKRLTRLEARLGVRLVQRTTRRLSLTGAGARFRDDLLPLVAGLAAAEARLTDARAVPSGPLRVTAPTSFGRLHVAPHLHRFLRQHPAVALSLDLSDGFVELPSPRIDVAVRIAASVPAALVAHRLAASRRILCAAPSYLAEAGAPATVADLARHRLLAAEGQSPWRLADDRRTATVEAASVVVTNSSEIVRELALTGVGIALRSLWDVGAALRDGSLVRVLPAWKGSADVAVYAVHAPGPMPAAVAAFVAFLRDMVDEAAWD